MLISKKSRNIENANCIPVKNIDFTLFERGREIINALSSIGCDINAGYRNKGVTLNLKYPEMNINFGLDKLDLFLWGEFNFFRVFRIVQGNKNYFGLGFEDQSVYYEQYEILSFDDIYNTHKASDRERAINYESDFGNRQYRISENDYKILVDELRKVH